MMARTALALAVAALASACSLAPTYERPAAPVASELPRYDELRGQVGAAAAPLAGTQAADLAWQQFFGDARLKRAIELALQNNRDLRVALANIDRARAQFGVARADRLPTVNLVGSGSRLQPNTANTGESVSSVYTAGLGITAFELDFFGRVRSLTEAAQAQYLATEEARKTTQITLIADLANAYLGWQANTELVKLTRETLVTREESFKLVKLKFDNGVVSELDLRQAESLVEGARATLAQQLRLQAQALNAMTLLIGGPLPADLPAGLPLLDDAFTQPVPVGLSSDVLLRRPDIRQSEQLLIASNANIGAARAAFFPRITLTGTFGVASRDLGDLFDDGTRAWTFGPQITMPLFDYGRTSANLGVAKANREIAVAQYEKAVQSAFREVADGLAGEATLGEQFRAQQAQARAETTRYQLTDMRYRNGVANYLDLMDAQRSLFAIQQAAVQARLSQLQNRVTLYKALGGGWSEPADAADAAVAQGQAASAAQP